MEDIIIEECAKQIDSISAEPSQEKECSGGPSFGIGIGGESGGGLAEMIIVGFIILCILAAAG